MINLLPLKVTNEFLSYLDMDDVSNVLHSCDHFKSSFPVLGEIIKQTRNQTIYANEKLLRIAYEQYPKLVVH
jgi:hypothetical protein